MQAATDEYIEQNDDRFGEVASLLLKGRADLAAECIDSPAAISLGEQGRHCIMTRHALELADLLPYRSCDLCCYGHVLTLCYPGLLSPYQGQAVSADPLLLFHLQGRSDKCSCWKLRTPQMKLPLVCALWMRSRQFSALSHSQSAAAWAA